MNQVLKIMSWLAFLTLPILGLEPLISTKGSLVYDNLFQKEGKLNPKVWRAVQDTNWGVESGVVIGRPTTEKQREAITAKQKADGNPKAGRSHLGEYARLNWHGTPNHTIIEMKFKMPGGIDRNNAYHRVIELGVHNARIQFEVDKTTLFANHNKEVLDQKEWVMPDGEWCVALFEIKEKDFCIQIENGPTFKGQSESFLTKPRRGKINLFGKKEGEVHIASLKIWEAL